MKAKLTVLALATMALCACGGASSDQDELSEEVEETAFDPMVETIDRAHGVEDIAAQRRDDIDKAIEESDGDDE